MDAYVDDLVRLDTINRRATELRRELSAIEKEQKTIKARIQGKMGTSTVGSINGIDAFEIVPTSRKSVPLDNVYEHAPKELWPLLIKENEGFNVKFLSALQAAIA